MAKLTKPQLKPIGSIVGIGGKSEVHAYLTSVFKAIGFEEDSDGLPAFAKYKGVIENKQIRVVFSLFKRTHYKGFDADHFVRYRTFEGIRMNTGVVLNVCTRLIVAKKITSKWLKLVTQLVMKFKQFKLVDKNYLGKELYSPDSIYALQVINDKDIKATINTLTDKQTKLLSWGVVQIPNQLKFGSTFADLTDFDVDKLQSRLKNIAKLAQLLDTKTVSRQLSLTKSEVLARDNPKASAYRALGFILLAIVLATGFLIGGLFLLAKLIGMV